MMFRLSSRCASLWVLCAVVLVGNSRLDASPMAEKVYQVKLSGGIRIEIVEVPFVADAHKIVGCRGSSHCTIDGAPPFGSQSEVPSVIMERISVFVNGREYLLPIENMYDAWGAARGSQDEHTRYRHFGGSCYSATFCTFRGVFSDGASCFAAQWEIIEGQPQRTVFTGSSDILDLFQKNIDPPLEIYD
jgi:hypothetical protein